MNANIKDLQNGEKSGEKGENLEEKVTPVHQEHRNKAIANKLCPASRTVGGRSNLPCLFLVTAGEIDGGGAASTDATVERRARASTATLLCRLLTGSGDEALGGDEGRRRRRSVVKIKKLTDGGISILQGDRGSWI
jgi:hypothetical protein